MKSHINCNVLVIDKTDKGGGKGGPGFPPRVCILNMSYLSNVNGRDPSSLTKYVFGRI